jgi:hypothetical protein
MVTSEVPAVIRQGAQRAPSLVAVKAKNRKGTCGLKTWLKTAGKKK